jgi:hypothetical protein
MVGILDMDMVLRKLSSAGASHSLETIGPYP